MSRRRPRAVGALSALLWSGCAVAASPLDRASEALGAASKALTETSKTLTRLAAADAPPEKSPSGDEEAPPKQSTAGAGAGAGDAAKLESKAPIASTDIPVARAAVTASADCPEDLLNRFGVPKEAALVLIDENLSIHPRSDHHLIEGQPLVVRFVVRKCIAPRHFATRSPAAENFDRRLTGPSVAMFANIKKTSTDKTTTTVQGSSDTTSHEGGVEKKSRTSTSTTNTETKEKVEDQSVTRQPPSDPACDVQQTVDFAFAPFSGDVATIYVGRVDDGFRAYELRSEVHLPIHKLSGGWIDVGLLTVGHQPVFNGAVRAESGENIPRLRADRTWAGADFAAFANLYLPGPIDPKKVSLSVGLGAGISVREPLDRFYPAALSVNFGRTLVLRVAFSLWRQKTLRSQQVPGEIWDGRAGAPPMEEVLVPGVGLGVGVDPSAMVDLLTRSFD